MLAKFSLWFLGCLLTICWLGTLSRTISYPGRFRFAVDDNTLFIGLSILLAGWFIAITRTSETSTNRVTSDYLKLLATLDGKNLTHNELSEEIGEDSVQPIGCENSFSLKSYLSTNQRNSLERLVYEGKIILRNGKYSLPDRSRS
ncbi:MAG: hypothetical protein ACSHYF_12910 [Verrucomicrobiaceae bacterium]